MLKFQVIDEIASIKPWRIRHAYLIGSDRSTMKAEISISDKIILCQKRETGAAALVMQQNVGECGDLMIQTCLLPERDEPYPLVLEQARHRVMTIFDKLEEWGMFDLGEESSLYKRVDRVKKLFVDALCLQGADPLKAEQIARECLSFAIDASEELAVAHATLFLNRRKQVASVPKNPIGCGVPIGLVSERLRASIPPNFDFAYIPIPWRTLALAESEYRWDPVDSWMDWAVKNKIPVTAGPVVSFDPSLLPDWAYIWEHDFETIRDLLYEHTQRVVTRYRKAVAAWNVVSGLHINNAFSFTFDQLMELTRMCTMQVKKVQPGAKVFVEIRKPFGEYYAANSKSIPPLVYADLLVQGSVHFDGFVIHLLMGQSDAGLHARDLMQISDLLDQFAVFGKSIHLVVGAPSANLPSLSDDPDAKAQLSQGIWRKPWSQLVQSRWLEAVFLLAISRPFVESVAWHSMNDYPNAELPTSGLIGEDAQPKLAYRRLVAFRNSLKNKPASDQPATPDAQRHPAHTSANQDATTNPSSANPTP